jgi:hypothetical protein
MNAPPIALSASFEIKNISSVMPVYLMSASDLLIICGEKKGNMSLLLTLSMNGVVIIIQNLYANSS